MLDQERQSAYSLAKNKLCLRFRRLTKKLAQINYWRAKDNWNPNGKEEISKKECTNMQGRHIQVLLPIVSIKVMPKKFYVVRMIITANHVAYL